MKRMGIALATVLILLSATACLAGPPLNGAYSSVDIGGPIPVGRYTEAWGGGGGALLAGTTFNAESWDGSALGTMWKYWCASEAANAVLLSNTVNGTTGNGNRTYMKTFVGGYIWLSGAGPWANGDASYPGVIDSYIEFETVTYQAWAPIAAVTNVQASAHFDNYPSLCMSFYIGNGTRVATTDLSQPIPANYPALLDQSCGATRTLGAAWDFTSITLSIVDCAVGSESKTWSGVKSMYAN